MKKILFAILLISSNLLAQNRFNAYAVYIEKYSPLAIEQQAKHRIPASITLAQGLLESRAGLGDLAIKSNNHFGIKCNNWNGEKVYYDDDAKGECFRKYNDVRESYEDHSLFLKNRSRYASLFNLQPTDYKGWAYGLKAAGYATDPNYANKLIRLIENYDLQQYDKGKTNKYSEEKIIEKKSTFGKKRGSNVLKEFPHELYKNNGVKCVFSLAGDTYGSIAAEYGLSEKKILQYNDLTESEKLIPNTVVYLQKKKNKASKEFSRHIVQEGESLYRISQKYAIKLQKLYDLNNIPYSQGASVGMILKLR